MTIVEYMDDNQICVIESMFSINDIELSEIVKVKYKK